VDATVVPNVRRQRGAAPASCARLQPRRLSHGRYVAFQMAEVAIPGQMFQEILRLIAELRPQPPPGPE